ncbi:MAG: thioredoxin [Spirosomataceae bacterium]
MEKKETFNEIIQGETPVLVDFFAEWCGPCKMMTPILKAFSTQMGDRVRVLKVDVDKNEKLSNTYKIQSMPTFLIFQKGKVVWRHTGTIQKSQLEQVINQLTAKTY